MPHSSCKDMRHFDFWTQFDSNNPRSILKDDCVAGGYFSSRANSAQIVLANLAVIKRLCNRLWHPAERTSSTPLLGQCWFGRAVLQALAAPVKLGSARGCAVLKER
jgi:hypothetical protein